MADDIKQQEPQSGNDQPQAGGNEDIEKLREALRRANAEAAERRKRLEQLEALVKQFEGVDPEEYRKLKEQQRKLEEERLKKEGEFEKLLAKRQQEWERKLKETEQKVKEWEQRYRQVAIDERLVAAFAKAGAIAPDEAMMLTRHFVDLDDKGVYVKGEDGMPLLGEGGKRLTLEEFAKRWLEEHPHHKRAPSGGAGSTGGQGKGRTMKRSEWERLDPMERVKVIKSGVQLVD